MVRSPRVLMLIWLVGSCAANAEPGREITVLGAGNFSCGKWSNERRSQSVSGLSAAQWVLGYVSAANRFLLTHDGDVAKNTDNAALLAWLDNYCSAHPLDNLNVASGRLILELIKKTGVY
jgi:hypothetical protein